MKFRYESYAIIYVFLFVFSGHTPANRHLIHIDISNGPTVELMSVWPSNGPELSWEYKGIGNGYSSPALDSKSVFVTGEIDSIGYLFSFDLKGELNWKVAYGKEWTKSYIGTRAAPTIIDNQIYVCSALGDIVCLEKTTGKISWSINMIQDLNGKNNVYGYSMQLLIDQNVLYCLPGGRTVNIAALDRHTGNTIWTSRGLGETAGYANPILIDLPERKILVCYSEYSLLGVDATTGELLWSTELSLRGEIPCNTPIYEDGYLYSVGGPGNGALKHSISNDGTSIEEMWSNLSFDTFFGGFVKNENYLYGAMNRKRALASLNIKTGEIKSTVDLRNGAIISADGLLYYYSEDGRIGLIDPNNGNLKLISSFRIKKGTREHFAHPVIHNGQLYIRHGNDLLVYNIQKS